MTPRNKRLFAIIFVCFCVHLTWLSFSTPKTTPPTLASNGNANRMQLKLIKSTPTPQIKQPSTIPSPTPKATPTPATQDQAPPSQIDQEALATAGKKIHSYDAQVALKIEQHKTYPPIALKKKKTGKVSVGFVINKLGELQSSAILKPSRYSPFNKAALDAIQNAAPFPPFPSVIKDKTRAYNTTITFTLN